MSDTTKGTLRLKTGLAEMLAADRTEASVALQLGPLTLDPTARLARLDGAPLELTRTEFGLLHLLLRCRIVGHGVAPIGACGDEREVAFEQRIVAGPIREVGDVVAAVGGELLRIAGDLGGVEIDQR